MAEINVEPTAEVIDNMAKRLSEVSEELRRTAERMRERSDLTYASEAINTISNMSNQLRLDLLVSRPLRELMK